MYTNFKSQRDVFQYHSCGGGSRSAEGHGRRIQNTHQGPRGMRERWVVAGGTINCNKNCDVSVALAAAEDGRGGITSRERPMPYDVNL